MEMKCIIKVYQFENTNGCFSKLIEVMNYEDINMSAKQLFEKVMIDKEEEMKNGFFIMDVSTSDDISDTHNFYSIRTDMNSKISEIVIAGPNVMDKSMLIDAIVGCKPKDIAVLSKFISVNDKQYVSSIEWLPDVKERLEKMNVLRLKEIYEKVKS